MAMNINDLNTLEDLAIEWGLTVRCVQYLCQDERIEGAVKKRQAMASFCRHEETGENEEWTEGQDSPVGEICGR